MWRWLIGAFCLWAETLAEVARYGILPRGVNPTLYSADDPIVQLDESTFNDTVFCHGDCTAYLVEFYSDWCGHCRSFAPLYKALARDVKGWQGVVRLGAMNCADPINEVTCRANGVTFYPYIKYFPRNSSSVVMGSKLRPYQSLSEMRDQLTKAVIDDYSLNRFPDWPTLDYLGDVVTYGELWQGSKSSATSMAIIFEAGPMSLIGAQLLLDLSRYSDHLLARRCLRSHPLVDALHITDFPTLAIFKRGERVPVLIAELRRLLLSEIENYIQGERETVSMQFSSRRNGTKNDQETNCDLEPEKCRPLYYVSESDMLKAMRYALFREVARTGDALHGANLTALHSFVSALSHNFPTTTSHDAGLMEIPLDRSTRAAKVFQSLQRFLESRGLDRVVTIPEWQSQFIRAEEENGNPFPQTVDWEHCKGSTSQYRGYTCGLWTTFHALTVSAYKNAEDQNNFLPLPVLQAIRDWVSQFFGCMHCRQHFLRMTTRTFKMEAQVRKPEDVFMYLWKAHNIVNARLKGRDTEDPKFKKYQFPAHFLCANCTLTGGQPDEQEIHNFLINYYSDIRPFKGEDGVPLEPLTE